MAYTNVIWAERAQAKIEATRGSFESTPTRWIYFPLGQVTWEYDQELEEIVESTRSRNATVDRQLAIRYCRLRFELNATYEEVVWWLRMALKGAAGALAGSALGSTPNAYSYEQETTGAADDLSTFSLIFGETNNRYSFKRCAVNRATFRWNPLRGGNTCWRIALECVAIFNAAGTAFAAPADITRTRILARGTKVYLDDSGGTIGTTQVTNTIRSGEFTIDNQIEEKVFSENTVDPHTDFALGNLIVTGSLVLEYLNDDEFAHMRAKDVRLLRIKQTGAQIGSTPTTNYDFQVDVPNAVYMAPSFSYAGQNKIITLPWVGQWTSAAPETITITTINAQANNAA